MPNDLDFFVALSSFNGDTGNLGQAIYAGTAVSNIEMKLVQQEEG